MRITRNKLIEGTSPNQISNQKFNKTEFDLPLRVQENLFKIQEKPFPKNKVIWFSLDSSRVRFHIFLFHECCPQRVMRKKEDFPNMCELERLGNISQGKPRSPSELGVHIAF